MAEGLCRSLKGDLIEPYSAGIEKHGLNQLAVAVLAELGIDISGHRSKTVDELEEKEFDYVITVCGRADRSCPHFPAKTRVIHQGFDDPPRLAADAVGENKALGHYRRVRDEIRKFILTLPQGFETDAGAAEQGQG